MINEGVPVFKSAKTMRSMSDEDVSKLLESLKIGSYIVVEPDNKLIFVYSWSLAQQRTMIILADSREEADSIFYLQFEECSECPEHFVPTFYVTELFADGGESTIIYNN